MASRSRSRAAGFTLVEILVALTIMALVIGMLTTVLMSTSRTHRRTTTRAEVQAASRATVSLMTTAIRQAGADPGIPASGLIGVAAADSHRVQVRADLNADGALQTTEPSEDVTFRYDPVARTVLRDPGTGAAILLENVTAMRFSYFDAVNAPLATLPLTAADRARVRSVGITLTCEEPGSNPFTLETRVTLRNQ